MSFYYTSEKDILEFEKKTSIKFIINLYVQNVQKIRFHMNYGRSFMRFNGGNKGSRKEIKEELLNLFTRLSRERKIKFKTNGALTCSSYVT